MTRRRPSDRATAPTSVGQHAHVRDTDDTARDRVVAIPLGADGRATYRVDEVARLLGVGRDTVYQAVERGEIPGALRIGRRLVFARAPFLAWLRNPAPSEE